MVAREIAKLSKQIKDSKQQKDEDGDAQIQDASGADTASEKGIVEVLVSFWIDFCKRMQIIRDVFMYLERTYLIEKGLSNKYSFW